MAEKDTVKIKTRDFGESDIASEDIYTFKKGLFAFEDSKKFTFISPINECGAPIWLQSCEAQTPCFIVFKSDDIITDYKCKPLKEDLETIEYEDGDEILYYNIAVIPDDYRKTTVNLKSPVIINVTKKLGVQAILPQNYEIRYSVYKEEDV